MKRTIDVTATANRSLKRVNSSLFSIATLVDDENNSDSNQAKAMACRETTREKSSIILHVGGGNATEDGETMTSTSAEETEDAKRCSSMSTTTASAAAAATSSEQKPKGNLLEIVGVNILNASLKAPVIPLEDEGGESPTDDAVSSSCSSSGFYVGDDDSVQETEHQQEVAVDPPCLPCTKNTEEFQIKGPAEDAVTETTTNKPTADHRTGLIFEAGLHHFDRHNRFHKERPLRVTSVHEYLMKAKSSSDSENDGERTIFERCRLMGGEEEGDTKSPEELWLDNDDYLRVHLPGYMQR